MSDFSQAIISDFLTYLEKERHYSKFTIIAYRYDLNRFVGYFEDYTGTPVSDFRDVDKVAIRYFLGNEFEDRFSSKTVARRLASVKSFFKYLLKIEEIRNNPTIHVKTPKTPKSLPVYVNEDVVEKLMDAPDSDSFIGLRDRAMLELFYSTGMRLRELVNIDLDDFHTENQLIKVTGKGGKERLIPYGKRAQFSLERFLEFRGIQLSAKEGIGPLFVNTKGRRLSPRTIQRRTRIYLKMVAEGERLGPHTLRHSFATHIINNIVTINKKKHKIDIRLLQELLGHSSISSTQIYTQIQPEKLKRIYKKAHPHGS